ncbi:MAG: cobyrinate a,c-diamide synthase [Desulfobacteraceae bacterium]|nr:cobyrinate a,c-diamide synthase [Desulfobacteraceae bacterium]
MTIVRIDDWEVIIKGVVIAGTKSGSGKTTISLGIMAALAKRGMGVAPFKVGPDFIDPGHHSRITGVTSRNLDGWMLSKEYNLENFERNTNGSDLAVVEGVMGLYDGYDGKSEAGSTAQMAKWLGLPILLVVDVKSMARSAAAVIMGFERFDPGLSFAGVVFNNLGSRRHLQYLMDAVGENTAIPCLGGLVIDEKIAIPERHLGLVTREDHALDQETIDLLADIVEKRFDLDLLVKNLPETNASRPIGPLSRGGRDKTVRIAVARDKAFCFYYQDNLELLEGQGAEIVHFSPIAGDALPQDIDGIYLGGGYPELFGDELAKNHKLRNQIRTKSDAGMPIYGECGGFMYLCKSLLDQHGKRYPMAGCFPFTTGMFPRLKALGYREVTLTRQTPIGDRGMILRGHEFHYSELTTHTPDVQNAYRISDRSGLDKPPDGYLTKRTLGSYTHLHFGSQPQAAKCFVENCLAYQRQKEKRI